VDGAGNVFVAEGGNCTIREITPGGAVTTLANCASIADGPYTGSQLDYDYPFGIAVDSSGNVYFTDSSRNTVRKITPSGGITTLAGTAGISGSTDGTGSEAQFGFPFGVAVDGAGNLYVVDGQYSTIRKITAAGVVTTIGGAAGVRGSVDGVGTTTQFSFPTGIAVDKGNSLYVADTFNNAIRKGVLAGPPVFLTQPQSQSAESGNSVLFSVNLSSLIAVTYQWCFNGNAISGATGASLVLSDVSESNAGNYTVVVANALGSITSDPATLTVSTAPSGGSGSSGGGGGAPSLWFVLALSLVVVARALARLSRPSVRAR